ncbi:MAG: hypothetical protein KDB90_05335 [Planctomycetes bacterium]|nr:hypothetical protein [Planctomycetota bacterium]
MTGRIHWWLAAAVLCLTSIAIAQDAPEAKPAAKPGQKVLDRAARDAARFIPQTGLGGDDTAKTEPNKTTFETVKIEVEGCEKMEGYICLPEGLDKAKQYALMFTFHGNGDVGAGRVKNVARITSERDPIITIGVQYQALTDDGKGKMGLPQLCSSGKIIEGSRWLLDKVKKDQPVDPDRVFVSGFSWGTSWASGWAAKEWRDDPENFPFRAVFLYSSGGAVTQETCPPCPWFCTVGSEETKVAGSVNVLAAVRHFCNVLASWGKPVLYHEIPGMNHAVNGRCHQITRDAINEMGGPGMLPYPSGDEGARAEPLPFEASDDQYVQELIELCNSDDWRGALDRIDAIDDDKSIPGKEKRAVKHFDKDIEKIAKKEVKRVDDLVADAIKAEKMPAPWQVKRLRAIVDTWPEETWIKGKGYVEHLATLDGDFAPANREREREQQMRDALALESQKDKRGDAKKLYEDLARRKAEDGGASIWPKAAEYRLKWWVD